MVLLIFLFKQKTAYEMRISDWSSDVCSSDLVIGRIIAVIAIAVGIGIGIIIIIIGATGIAPAIAGAGHVTIIRSEEHTSELQSLMRISYAVFCLKKKNVHIIKMKQPRHFDNSIHAKHYQNSRKKSNRYRSSNNK